MTRPVLVSRSGSEEDESRRYHAPWPLLVVAVGASTFVAMAPPAFADSPTSLTSVTENGFVVGTPERGVVFLPQLQLEFGRANTDEVTGASLEEQVRRGTLITVANFDAFGATLAYSFASDANPVIALYADWQPVAGLTVRIGQQNAPLSLDDMTSSRYLTFAERSAASALVPGDAFGLAASYSNEHGTVAGGVYGGNVNTGLGEEGVLAIVHGSIAPVNDRKRTLHFGAGLGWRDVADASTRPSFAGTIGSGVYERRLTSTGTFEDAYGVGYANVEFAWVDGPFSVQGEVTGAQVDRTRSSDAHLWGGYAFATWTFTGERRPYSIEAADFTRIEPDRPVWRGGPGAWEIGARIDHLDLSDVAGSGRQTGVSGVVNWYLDVNNRLTFDATRTFVDGGGNDGATVDATVLRYQFTF